MSYEVTGLVIAKNEERDLPGCLDVFTELCATTIVVDNESEDATIEIARSYGASAIRASMDDQNGYAGLRNIGLEEVETSHVLVLDADERPNDELMASLKKAIADKNDEAAYALLRRNYVFGKSLSHGRFGSDIQTRLFPSDTRYSGAVHELPVLATEREPVVLDGELEHFTYESFREYASKMRNYSERQASMDTKTPSMFHMFAVPIHHLLLKEGYKDGWRGVVMAAGDGWYDHLVRTASKK